MARRTPVGPAGLGGETGPADDDLPRPPEPEPHEEAGPYRRSAMLLDAALEIGAELDLNTVLGTIVDVSMRVVPSRYGALGVLDESGGFSAMISRGYCSDRSAARGEEMPHGTGLLGELVRDPRPLRLDDLSTHPGSAGFPEDHPVMTSLLGVPIEVRTTVYGNLYLADKIGGPYTQEDEDILIALARVAGVAIENAHLYRRLRRITEDFQRRLLPPMPQVEGWELESRYLPATRLPNIGGDWYDLFQLPDGAACLAVGDVMGHDARAANTMAQISNMLRVVAYYRREPPSDILHDLDRALHDLHGGPMATVLLARVEPSASGAALLRWASAGHLPPLLVVPGERARFLRTEPGLPLGVDFAVPRPDHHAELPAGAAVLLYTDGLVEHHDLHLDDGMRRLADIATAHADAPLTRLCDALLDATFDDDVTLLAVRSRP
jgi:serine phosphatase RsbU (regulator of sigma subunit)